MMLGLYKLSIAMGIMYTNCQQCSRNILGRSFKNIKMLNLTMIPSYNLNTQQRQNMFHRAKGRFNTSQLINMILRDILGCKLNFRKKRRYILVNIISRYLGHYNQRILYNNFSKLNLIHMILYTKEHRIRSTSTFQLGKMYKFISQCIYHMSQNIINNFHLPNNILANIK